MATAAAPLANIQQYKEYITGHALKYVGDPPDQNDPTFQRWYRKLQKVEKVLHKKYLRKLARELHSQQARLNQATPQTEYHAQLQNDGAFPDTSPIAPHSPQIPQLQLQQQSSTKSAYDDYFGFDGITTPDSHNSAAEKQVQNAYDMAAFHQNQNVYAQQCKQQHQVMNQMNAEQRQKNLVQVVMNQRKKLCVLQEKYVQNEQLLEEYRNKNAKLCQEYERMVAELANAKQKTKKLAKEYATLKERVYRDQSNDHYSAVAMDEAAQSVLNTPASTAAWIVSLDEQRFGKYFGVLSVNLKKEMIDGSCLSDLTADDLYRCGIVNFKDKRDIMRGIRKFVQQSI